MMLRTARRTLVPALTQKRSLVSQVRGLWEAGREVMGMRELDRVKAEVERREAAQEAATAARSEAIGDYDKATETRGFVQAELSKLLRHQDTWTETDVEKFTALTQKELETRRCIAETLARRNDAEKTAEIAQRDFLRAVQERYHTENVFKEKYQALMTYITPTVLVVNTLTFIGTTAFRSYQEGARLDAMEAHFDRVIAAVDIHQPSSPRAVTTTTTSTQTTTTHDSQVVASSSSSLTPLRDKWNDGVALLLRQRDKIDAETLGKVAGGVTISLLLLFLTGGS